MTRALVAVLLVVAWVGTWRPALDPDLWWHIAFGEVIRRDGAIPSSEFLSWWTAGEPLVVHSWAWDVLVSVAFDLGGPLGVSILGMAVSAAIVGLLGALVRVSAGERLGPVGGALTVVVAVVSVVPLWSPRAGMLDLAAVLALALAWSLYLRRGTAAVLGTVPVITVAWANFHGSAILAYVACLLALAAAVAVGVRWGTWPARPIRPLVLTSAAGALALLVNPYGPMLMAYALDSRVASAMNHALDEWRSPDFTSLGLLGLRLVLAAGVLIAIALRGRRRDPLLLLLATGWTFLALGSVRFALIAGPLLVIALAPGVAGAARAWADLGSTTGRRSGAAAGTASPPALVIGGLAAVAVGAVLLTATRLVAPATQDALVAARFPIAAVDAARDGCDGRLFNAYDWGGYIAHAWGPPVAAYGNSPGHVVDAQADLENLRTDPAPFLDQNGVDLSILKSDSPLSHWMRLSPTWETRYEDDLASVFTRVGADACQML